ncbi:MAG TPA: DNA polymerase III subunit alpha, partial [Candidatus Ozemobacteraceae bacterium]|nr:DNA polymerase III subunit alpha [Candidatus Ozemobacteraceae bacterium]
MYHSNFVHLHVHSHYSLLDGAASVKSIVEAARRYRMPAIALTDHGNMFGAIDFYGTAMKRGVKPILGFESYVVEGSRHARGEAKENKYYHLTLLARDMIGYKNLIKLTSFGYTEGFYYKPRIDWEVLEKHNQGLIVLSGCLQGRIPQLLLQGKPDEADATARRYQDIFGRENFYIEIMNHAIEDEMRVLGPLIELSRRLEIPLVATNDSHYASANDWEAQDALLCLATNKLLNDPTRWRFESRDLYVKSPQQMAELFREVPEALTNTMRVADRCNVILPMGKSILPHFELPDGLDSNAYLDKLCREALPGRYGDPIPPEIINRLEYELGVIKRMGFPDYFLIVWDFIAEARRIGVPVGPGRGSAAGSIVAYLLGITDIDPLKYGLLFERFLNPDRISMPDIDIDFSDEGRERVIEYVVRKYGREKVSQVITFNTMLAKMAIRDIGRVMGIPIPEVDKLAKLVPEKPGTHLKKVLSEDGELKTVNESGTEQEKQLLRIAASVDGMVRHTGVHAAGVVISREPIMDIVPLYKDPKSGAIVTQYEKNAIEKIGLLKMDFLGLKTLSVIQRALDYIKEGHGVELNLGKLTVDDQATYDLLCRGLTMGVFQLESSGMRSLITRLRPTVFEDIIALLAMYRPGPLGSGMVDDFVECKHGRKKIVYPHPDLEPVLKDTYGVFLYQEQCMQTANILA